MILLILILIKIITIMEAKRKQGYKSGISTEKGITRREVNSVQ